MLKALVHPVLDMEAVERLKGPDHALMKEKETEITLIATDLPDDIETKKVVTTIEKSRRIQSWNKVNCHDRPVNEIVIDIVTEVHARVLVKARVVQVVKNKKNKQTVVSEMVMGKQLLSLTILRQGSRLRI